MSGYFYHIISSRILREQIGAGQDDCVTSAGQYGYYVFNDKIYEVINWSNAKPCLRDINLSIEKLIYNVFNNKESNIVYFSLYIKKYDEKSFIGFNPSIHKDQIIHYLKKKAKQKELFTSKKVYTTYLDNLGTFEELKGPSGKPKEGKSKYTASDMKRTLPQVNKTDKKAKITKSKKRNNTEVVSNNNKKIKETKPDDFIVNGKVNEKYFTPNDYVKYLENTEIDTKLLKISNKGKKLITKTSLDKAIRKYKKDKKEQEKQTQITQLNDELKKIFEIDDFKKVKTVLDEQKAILDEIKANKRVVEEAKLQKKYGCDETTICKFIEKFNITDATYLENDSTYEIQVVGDKNYKINFDDDSAIIVEGMDNVRSTENKDGWKECQDPPYVLTNNIIQKKNYNADADQTIVSEDIKKYREYDFYDNKLLKKEQLIDTNIQFAPLQYQYHTLKYSGNKILLAHNPGFGKTINALLLAQKFRNQEQSPPKVIIVAPDATILTQWVDEIKRLFPVMAHDCIWYTYDMFMAVNTSLNYPEWENLIDDNKKLNEDQKQEIRDQYTEKIKMDTRQLVGKRIANKTALTLLSGNKSQYQLKESKLVSVSDQSERIFCEVCKKGRHLNTGLYNWKEDFKDDSYKKIKTIMDGFVHSIEVNKKTTSYERRWRLYEDKMFLVCSDCMTQIINPDVIEDIRQKEQQAKEASKNIQNDINKLNAETTKLAKEITKLEKKIKNANINWDDFNSKRSKRIRKRELEKADQEEKEIIKQKHDTEEKELKENFDNLKQNKVNQKNIENNMLKIEAEIKKKKEQKSNNFVDAREQKISALFLTGFTLTNKWTSFEDYFNEQDETYDKFVSDLKTTFTKCNVPNTNNTKEIKKTILDYAYNTAKIEKKVPVQFVHYMYQTDFGKKNHLHLYRPPKDCILIADEVHLRTGVGGKLSLIMQTLWKYASNTKYTIFCTATPLSSPFLFKQVYTLSQMLTDKGEEGTKNPIWCINTIKKRRENVLKNYDNVFQVAELMKYKISKHNTVENVDKLIKSILEKNQFDKQHGGDLWYPFYMENLHLLNAFVGESPYKEVTTLKDNNGIEPYVKEALKRIFINQNAAIESNIDLEKYPYMEYGTKSFPVLKTLDNKSDELNYLQNTFSVYQPKRNITDLSYISKNGSMDTTTKLYDLEINDKSIRVVDGNTYSLDEIHSLEQLIYTNVTKELYTFYFQPTEFNQKLSNVINHDFGSNCVFQNQTHWNGLVARNTMKIQNNKLLLNNIEIDIQNNNNGLKYLYVHPCTNKHDYDMETCLKFKENKLKISSKQIPYIPELETTKLKSITSFIEEQVDKSKNLMVYFKEKNPSKSLIKSLYTRNHKSIEKINNLIIEKKLSRHALYNALKRWRKWFVEGVDDTKSYKDNNDLVWDWVLYQDREFQYVAKLIEDANTRKYKVLYNKEIKEFTCVYDNVNKIWNYTSNEDMETHKKAVKEYYDEWVQTHGMYLDQIGIFNDEIEKIRKKADFYTYCKDGEFKDAVMNYKKVDIGKMLDLIFFRYEFESIVFGGDIKNLDVIKNLQFCYKNLFKNNKLIEKPKKESELKQKLDLLAKNSGNDIMIHILHYIFYHLYTKRKNEWVSQSYPLRSVVKEYKKDIESLKPIDDVVFDWDGNQIDLNDIFLKEVIQYQKYFIKHAHPLIEQMQHGLTHYFIRFFKRNDMIQELLQIKKTDQNDNDISYIQECKYVKEETDDEDFKGFVTGDKVWYIVNGTILNSIIESENNEKEEYKLSEGSTVYRTELFKSEADAEKYLNEKIEIGDDVWYLDNKLKIIKSKLTDIDSENNYVLENNVKKEPNEVFRSKEGAKKEKYLQEHECNIKDVLKFGDKYYQKLTFLKWGKKDKKDKKNRWLSKQEKMNKTLLDMISSDDESIFISFIYTNMHSKSPNALNKIVQQIVKKLVYSHIKDKNVDDLIEDNAYKDERKELMQPLLESARKTNSLSTWRNVIELMTYRKQIVTDKIDAFDYKSRLGYDIRFDKSKIIPIYDRFQYYFTLVKDYNTKMQSELNNLQNASKGQKKEVMKKIFNLQGLDALVNFNDEDFFKFKFKDDLTKWNQLDLIKFMGSFYCFKKSLTSYFIQIGSGKGGYQLKVEQLKAKEKEIQDQHNKIQKYHNDKHDIMFCEVLKNEKRKLEEEQTDDEERRKEIKNKLKNVNDQLKGYNAATAIASLDTSELNKDNIYKWDLSNALRIFLQSKQTTNKKLKYLINGEVYDYNSDKTLVENVNDLIYTLNGMKKIHRLNFAYFSDFIKEEDKKKLKHYFKIGGIDLILTNKNGIQGVDYKSCSESITVCGEPFSSPANQDQFVGRLVRKNSHQTLPDKYKYVETVTYYSEFKKSNNKKEEKKKDDKCTDPTTTFLTRGIPYMRGSVPKTLYSKGIHGGDILVSTFTMVEPSTEKDNKKLSDYITELKNQHNPNNASSTSKKEAEKKCLDMIDKTYENKKINTLKRTESEKQMGYINKFTPKSITAWYHGTFEKCINLAYVYACNNLVYLSKDLYEQDDKKGSFYCFYCTNYCQAETCDRCNTKLKKDGVFKHYKLREIDTPKNMFVLDKFCGEQQTLKNSELKKQQKDRMEMAMLFNSIEHQSKLQGNITHRFAIQEEDNTVHAFYKRVQKDKIQTNKDKDKWQEMILNPEEKPVYKYVVEPEKRPEIQDNSLNKSKDYTTNRQFEKVDEKDIFNTIKTKFELKQTEEIYNTYTALILSIKEVISKYKINTPEKKKAEQELKKLEKAKKDIHWTNTAREPKTQITNLYKLLNKSIYFRDNTIKKNFFTGDPETIYVIIKKTKTKDGIEFEYLVNIDGIKIEEPTKRSPRQRKQLGAQMQSIFVDDDVVWIIEDNKAVEKQYGDIKNQVDDNDIYGTQDEAEKEIKYKNNQIKKAKKDEDYQIDTDDIQQLQKDQQDDEELQIKNCTPQFDHLQVIETVLDGNCFFDAVLKFMKNNGSTNAKFLEIWNAPGITSDTQRCSIFRTKLAEFLDDSLMTYTISEENVAGVITASDVSSNETNVVDKESHKQHLNSLEYAQDYDSALVSKYLDVCIFTYNLNGNPISDRFYNQNDCINKEKILVLYCGQGNSKHYKTFKVEDGYMINERGYIIPSNATSGNNNGPTPFKIELEY